MALKIYWTKRAYHKFDDIILYLTTNWGEKTISIFVKKVYDFFDILTVFPDIGTIENESKNFVDLLLLNK
jgi:plasmid stabilization system protein ParE